MVSRPLTVQDLKDSGIATAEAFARVDYTHALMQTFIIKDYVIATNEYVFMNAEGETENAVATRLMAEGDFAYVEPDWMVYPVGNPNDPQFSSQWHHQANIMDSAAGWDLHTGNPSVGIAICDTGVLTSHEDLQLHRNEGYNAVDRVWESAGGNIGPVHPHGTNTTGCAAANGNNGVGISGVGWNLSHRMMRVSNSSGGNAFMSDLTHAARTAIEAGDKVASVSYSGADSNTTLSAATYIKSIGGLCVWAAGNDSRNLTFGDRDADDLIVVGGSDNGDGLAWFSAYGQFVDVVAPGTGVYTTDDNGGYTAVSGTSFSTPLTAGLIGMIFSANPSLTPQQVEDMLKSSVDDLGSNGLDNTFGYGRINLATAMAQATGGGGGGGGGGNPTPPVADFSATPLSGTTPLNVSFTDLTTNAPTSWSWDFGDGGTSNAQHPSYTYNNAGTYDVTLTATNADGSDTRVRTGYITVNSSGGGGGGGIVGEGFVLDNDPGLTLDQRTFSTSDTLYMYIWSDQVDYTNLKKAQWELRDTQGNKVKMDLVSNGDGSYNASYALSNLPSNDSTWTWKGKLKDRNGARYQPQVTLTITTGGGGGGPPAPVADFSGNPTSGTVPLTVDFTDLSSNTPTTWSWDYGDGASASGQNPTHTYTQAGNYTVTLTATNAGGADTLVQTNYITVNPAAGNPPVADLVASTTNGNAPLLVDFTDLSSNNPTSWSWDFGDGGTSTAQNPSYTYNTPGTYDVSLTATNADGTDTVVFTGYITVNNGGGGGGGGVVGEGFILSLNADFSTDDRSFTRGDVIYMKVWSDQIDFTDMKKNQWELKDPNKNKVKLNLTNLGDGNFTASFVLSGLPSNDTSWTWKGKLEDNPGTRYKPRTQITVN
ncbi:MAG: PKD domain-containing protein [Planctomycetota bacterium]